MDDDDFYTRVRNRAASAAAGTVGGGRSYRGIIIGAVALFLLGAIAIGVYSWSSLLPGDWGSEEDTAPVTLASGELQGPDGPSPSPSASAEEVTERAAQAVEKAEQVAEQQGGLDARLAAMEQRVAKLDLQAQAAAGNAARAEGLLIAFATRRAIERGENLGYLEDQLELRFGAAEPDAVKAVVAAAEKPVTLEQLMARLEALSPKLARRADEEVSWSWFKRELSELFIVRKQATPSPVPEQRLARARIRLESGMIEGAIGEVRNLPGADEARQWIADAERYAAALRALDRLEQSAILEPRELRDASGNRVEQPSLAQ